MTVIKAILCIYSKLQLVVDKYIYVLRWIIIRATFIYCLPAQNQNNEMRGKEKKLCFGFVKCFMEGRHFTSLQLPTSFFLGCSESPNILLVIVSCTYIGYIYVKQEDLIYVTNIYGGTKVKS